MNEKPSYDPGSLQLIFTALVLTQLVITTAAVYLLPDDACIRFSWKIYNNWLLPMLSLMLARLGKAHWNRGMQKISETEDLDEKMYVLMRIHIWQWICVELGTVLLMMFTLIESNGFYFLLGLVNMIYFFTLRPKIFSLNRGI
jgi:succinate dehydrogenase hydrophobic anchor subunit